MAELLHVEDAGESDEEPPILTVTFDDRESVCVLTLSGQLTRTSVAALDAQVDQIGCSKCTELILDVTGLIGLDAVGSRALVGLSVYLRALGARLTVNGANEALAEAMALQMLVPLDNIIGMRAAYLRYFWPSRATRMFRPSPNL
jgi:anti-anti-sigma factor